MQRVSPVILLPFLLLACSDDDGAANQNNQNNENGNNSQVLCGNGVQEGAEECDDGAQNSDTVPNACRTDCVDAHCGDGVTDDLEECDDGAQNSAEVPDACRPGCTFPTCGDGVTDLSFDEGCDCGDGTVPVPSRCSGPNSDGDGATCHTDCVPVGCGDGVRSADELCDGTDLGTGSCQEYGYYHGDLECTASCSYNKDGCYDRCGDDIVNGTEVCDGTAPAGQTCLDFGFDRGPLSCSDYCTPGYDDCGYIGWKRQATGSSDWFNEVWVAPTGEVFVAGSRDGGLMLHFDGAAWSEMTLPANTPGLRSVYGFSADDVVAVGDTPTATILRYDGTSWSSETTSGYLFDVWGSSPSNIIIVGQHQTLSEGAAWRYDGSAWSAMTLPGATQPLKSVWGSGPDDVYAVGGQSTIVRYNGTSWSPVSHGHSGSFEAVWGSAANDVFVGGGTTMLHYDGSQWEQMTLPSGVDYINDIWGTSGDNVFAALGGFLQEGWLLHYDGETWRVFDEGTIPSSFGIHGTSGSNVYAVGPSGSVLRFHGLGWTSLDISAIDVNYVTSIWGTSNTNLYVTGQGNSPMNRFDGTGWSTICPGYAYCDYLHAIWGSGPEDVYFVGGEMSVCADQVIHYSSGTCTNATVSAGFAEDVAGNAANNIYVTSSDGSYGLAHFTSTWNPLTQVTGALYGVWVAPDDQVFAVGNNQHIWHYDTSWTLDTTSSPDSLFGVWGSASSDVFAVGPFGTVLRFDGATWSVMETPTAESLDTVWGSGPNNVYAAGDWGALIHFDGTTWSPIRTDGASTFHHIWGTGHVVYFVVTEGTQTRIRGLLSTDY